MTILRKVFRIILITFILLLVIVLLFALWQYMWGKKYNLRTPKKFEGNFWYNPYAGKDENGWIRANFHVHSNAWGNLTNGRHSNPHTIDSLYHLLGYEVACISDYQSINRLFSNTSGYLPVYEHGYGPARIHHQMIGAKSVNWKEYLLPQSLHNRQEVIDCLRKDSDAVVVMNHPEFSLAVSPGDFRFLGNYHNMEILSRVRQSMASWDTALSSGYPAFATANDDGHDIRNLMEVGKNLTLLYAQPSESAVKKALRSGATIAVDLPIEQDSSLVFRKKLLQQLRGPASLSMRGDTLRIRFSRVFSQLSIKSQGGKTVFMKQNDSTAIYVAAEKDTYLRTELTFQDGTRFFLNPVFRYNGKSFSATTHTPNNFRTIVLRSLALQVLALLVFFFYLRFKHVRRKKSYRHPSGL
jgi:hypothetical protein